MNNPFSAFIRKNQPLTILYPGLKITGDNSARLIWCPLDGILRTDIVSDEGIFRRLRSPAFNREIIDRIWLIL